MSELEFDYDEEAAVKFIRNYLPQELKDRFSDDDIYYLLDVICDFYDENDYLDEEDEEKEEKELIRFIIRQAQKDGIGEYTEEEILLFLKAEDAYSDTLDFFE
ncbi:MAG: hypothetical protein LBP72_03900 [Dysgonamonadaceae bacterium]|jgi:hypothetical protein|nr:hypothetical protein [Dysgonamonadaceae bacterium]